MACVISTSVVALRATACIDSSRGGSRRRASTRATAAVGGGLRTSPGHAAAVERLERLLLASHPPPASGAACGGGGVRVAYQGVRGSYCQEAALALAPPSAAFPCGAAMEAAFAALEDGSADRAVVPAENSLDGPVDRNLDLLLRHPRVRILRELVLPVRHSLLLLPSPSPTPSIRRVLGHPQALRHCARALAALPVAVEPVADAAAAARLLANGSSPPGTAVVGSAAAAREFGLRVLRRDFQDSDDSGAGNFTRYLQLGVAGAAAAPGPHRKTTVAFTLERGPSDLHLVLWALASRGVHALRLDHRPNRTRPVRSAGGAARFDYVFVLDVQGGESEPRVAAALAHVREISASARVLGSYNCFHVPHDFSF